VDWRVISGGVGDGCMGGDVTLHNETAFTCAVCQREVTPDPWRKYGGRDGVLPPFCRQCEFQQATSMTRGAFMDRRIAMQGKMVAEELGWMAHRVEGGRRP
jgi:hypothetical protein